METAFNTLKLKKEILDNLESLEFKQMTPIQAASLPVILEGKDVIAKAKTGSGKTLAFGLSILNQINTEEIKLNSLILCPTRELAEQVADELRRLARTIKNMKILVVCGGAAEYHQLKSLEHGVHIIVGTPGRVLKFLKEDQLDISKIKYLVLDEADRMLDMGFHADMKEINAFAPFKKQTLLFSATFPDEIEELSSEFQQEPVRVEVDEQHAQNVIEQTFIEVPTHPAKMDALLKVLCIYKPESAIIFCKTKQTCAEVAESLSRKKISALPFHGDLEQNERNLILSKFSNKSALILVATDVAARGLDIKDLKAVINFDLAYDPEVYTHRIGRSGRAGNVGQAISLYVPYEKEKIQGIEEYLNTKNTHLNLSDLNPEGEFDIEAPMKTLFISGGKKDKVRPGDILGAIVKEAGIEAKHVGNINVLNVFTYVAIEKEYFETVVNKLNNGKIKGRKFRVGPA